jgi:hypothetical protein
MGGPLEIVQDLHLDLGLEASAPHRHRHVPEPGVTLGGPDGEGEVAHAQTGMAPLLAVGRRSAPILDEEPRQVVAGLGQIVGVHRSQDGVFGHAFVEALNQGLEPRRPAHQVIERHAGRAYPAARVPEMQGDHRGEMLLRLGRVLDAQAARGGHAARERIDLLLDRDSPFLELAPLADGDAVVGIGVVEATVCLLVSGDRRPADPDEPKVVRATARASACGLPVVLLDDLSGSADALRHHRRLVRWGPAAAAGRRRRPAAPDIGPPPPDPDALLDVPPPREILRHVVDGSVVDELRAGAGGVTGWATVGGLPVGVVARDAAAPASAPPELADMPLLRLTVTAVPGSAPEIGVSVSTATSAFRFSWPGPEPPTATADHDGVIDPRDTRIVVGIARWCLEPS